MARAAFFFGWLVLAFGASAQSPEASVQPLRVLYLGETGTERSAEFEAFLTDRFAAVQTADRWSWDREVLADVDVVVLDWPQADGISKWMLNGDRSVPPRQPLGPRDEWTMPTVLLGSAGLNLAWAWDVKGAFG